LLLLSAKYYLFVAYMTWVRASRAWCVLCDFRSHNTLFTYFSV